MSERDIGWVKVYRKLFNSQFGGNIEMIGLFTSLLLKANHQEGYTADGTKILPGQFMTSQMKLAAEFRMNRESLRRRLKMLENAKQIEQSTSNKNTIITITNWQKYQASEQQVEQQVSSKLAASEQQVSTNKNDNNNNNEKKIYIPEEISNSLFDEVIQAWNEICGKEKPFRPVGGLKTETSNKFFNLVKLNHSLKEVSVWEQAFKVVKNNSFLKGQEQGSKVVANLPWLIDKEIIVDVVNGQYGAESATSLSAPQNIDEIYKERLLKQIANAEKRGQFDKVNQFKKELESFGAAS